MSTFTFRTGDSEAAFTPDVHYLGAMNALAVMEIIRVLGPISRAELARQSQFKPAALTGLVRYLVNEGLVIVAPFLDGLPAYASSFRGSQDNAALRELP